MDNKQFSGYSLTCNNVEYYTPGTIIEKVRQVLEDIDLDPASCEEANKIVQAKRFYTKEQDGLQQQWYGNVYLNPPYGTTKKDSTAGIWSRKMIEEYRAGNIKAGILLVNAALSYKWFQPLYEYPICFPHDRLNFIHNTDLKARKHAQNTAIIYFGEYSDKFTHIFQDIGTIMHAVS